MDRVVVGPYREPQHHGTDARDLADLFDVAYYCKSRGWDVEVPNIIIRNLDAYEVANA